jgi:acyl carrier protein
MTENESIKNQIRAYLKESSVSSAEIEYDTKIFDQGLLDSMGLLFLIEYLNETFQVEVKDHELDPENFESIEKITTFILKKKRKNPVKRKSKDLRSA